MAKYFTDAEFRGCNPPCGIEDMDAAFLATLDKVREAAGIPLVLNSAYRPKSWELQQGRSGNSAHTRGKAVDIRCNTSGNKFKVVQAALACGFTRIGVGATFVHIDNDDTLPQSVIWTY